MKIPLKVEESAGGLKPFAYFSIKAPHTFGKIKAFFDTGSPDTIISESEALRLKIPFADKQAKTSYGVGGDPISLYEAKISSFSFIDDKEELETIESPLVYISRCMKKEDRRMITAGMPNILGVDFLLKNQFKLFFDPYNKVAFIEK